LNPLNTEFPARSGSLRIAPQRVAVVDALVFQFDFVAGEVGAVRLRYADGGERVLPILNDRDTRALLDIRPTGASGRRIGWLGTYATALRGWGMADLGDMTILPTFVVRLENPEPDRPVASISLEAPPTASPGLLFLALTLEPAAAGLHRRGLAAPLHTVAGTHDADRGKRIAAPQTPGPRRFNAARGSHPVRRAATA
jgi:hypothetical protein